MFYFVVSCIVPDGWWPGAVCNRMDLLPDTQNCALRMRRECRERFPCHRLQRKPLVSDPDMHHGTCVTHVPWCMSGTVTRCGEENVPIIPGACATLNFTYLVRDPQMTAFEGLKDWYRRWEKSTRCNFIQTWVCQPLILADICILVGIQLTKLQFWEWMATPSLEQSKCQLAVWSCTMRIYDSAVCDKNINLSVHVAQWNSMQPKLHKALHC